MAGAMGRGSPVWVSRDRIGWASAEGSGAGGAAYGCLLDMGKEAGRLSS
ncbi:hypothetical protein [Streptomyces sp. NPDC015345]